MPDVAVLSLDFGKNQSLSDWIAHPDTKLLLSNRRLAALGFSDRITDQSPEAGSIISVPAGTDKAVLLTLIQGNPNALGVLDAEFVAGLTPAGTSILSYLKLAQALPAALLKPASSLEEPASVAPAVSLLDYHHTLANSLQRVGDTPIPLEGLGQCRMHLFRDALGNESHLAVEVGNRDPAGASTLVRVHSSCVTGDIFNSQRCDCGHQLHGALRQMAKEGHGVLVYLAQEGRGIGLNNKLKSYLLQQAGLDTVEGNLALGYEDDERDFTYARRILSLLGVGQVRLLTNNPAKVKALQGNGINIIKRIPLIELHSELSTSYLTTKATKSGHLIDVSNSTD